MAHLATDMSPDTLLEGDFDMLLSIPPLDLPDLPEEVLQAIPEPNNPSPTTPLSDPFHNNKKISIEDLRAGEIVPVERKKSPR